MTFPDLIEHPSKLVHSISMNSNLNKKEQHRKIKRLHTSILNLFPHHRQTKNINEQIQPKNSFLHPPSIITTSELSRSISNRSITFASVFDELENDNTNPTPFDRGTPIENEDLVIVVPNKYVNNEPTINNSNTEPYPFRSEILPKSYSPMNTVNSSDSKKKSFHNLIRSYRQPKKLRHPVKTNQSTSAPNLFFSLSSIPPPTTTNNQHRSLKTFRQWFKSLSFGRFLQSFRKHSNGNTKHHKQKSHVKPTISQKNSDLIY